MYKRQVIASDTPSVMVGDETASEVDVALEEDFVVAYGDRHEPWLAFRIASHFDVVERTLSSGEQILVENNERPWWQREVIRIEMSEELIGASVPTDVELEPVAYSPEVGVHDVTLYPERDVDLARGLVADHDAGRVAGDHDRPVGPGSVEVDLLDAIRLRRGVEEGPRLGGAGSEQEGDRNG